ncbi:ArsR/SmtB family transcription factor [Natrarchaeobaculum aegyptiacum]|uniref:ArsR family transcriptional regulator n=1 Tax=Natrarchaeobaculum aegyptiacum TaxID=745377 RepID=A0A2Z2HUA6_9EURY|nr:helix-turn-helix domain-containing protein [Natrarchaeobaculum aegyptiacum]ARS90353.1 ArsR family transcriptional regulator [Natrarchaeobaculum aegyptiacum]
MARLFPFRSETPAQEGPPRVVDLEGEDADAVFSALSSTTAREIYARLDEEPGTPSDVAEAIDSSIQNVRYHLEKLEDAGLVEVVDTWYSSRGNEMSVYATTNGPLIVTSDESTGAQLKRAISRLIGAIGALAGGSLLVQYGATQWFDAAGSGVTEDAAPAPAGDEYERATDAPDEPDEPAADDAGVTAFDEDVADDAPEDDVAAADAAPMDEAVEEDAPADEPVAEPDDEALDADAPADDVEPEGVVDGGLELVESFFSLSSPGMVFFLGGLAVLLGLSVYWYLAVYREQAAV